MSDLPLDTTVEAYEVLLESLRRLGPEGRQRKAFEAREALRRRTEAGIRLRHPEYTDRQVFLARARLYLGDELHAAVYGAEGDVRP